MQTDFSFSLQLTEFHCAYVPHFHYLSSIEGHLGCLYFLVIMMNVMNAAKQISRGYLALARSSTVGSKVFSFTSNSTVQHLIPYRLCKWLTRVRARAHAAMPRELDFHFWRLRGPDEASFGKEGRTQTQTEKPVSVSALLFSINR